MELIISYAAFTLFWLSSSVVCAHAAYEEYKYNGKITYEALTNIVWAVGNFCFPFIMATNSHNLFTHITGIKIVFAIYTVMIAMWVASKALPAVACFKKKGIALGVGIIFIIFMTLAISMALLPMNTLFYIC